MFCPKCGHYLNSNIKECPYCGSKLSTRSSERSDMMEKKKESVELDPENIPEIKDEGVEIIDDVTEEPEGKPRSRYKDRYALVTLISGIVMAACPILPWVTWIAETGTVYYNAIDLISFKWEGAFSMTKYFPIISCILGMIVVILSVVKENATTFYILLIIGLLCTIDTALFLIGIMYDTGLEAYLALGLVLVASLFITFCTIKRVENINRAYKKKKKAEAKKKKTE